MACLEEHRTKVERPQCSAGEVQGDTGATEQRHIDPVEIAGDVLFRARGILLVRTRQEIQASAQQEVKARRAKSHLRTGCDYDVEIVQPDLPQILTFEDCLGAPRCIDKFELTGKRELVVERPLKISCKPTRGAISVDPIIMSQRCSIGASLECNAQFRSGIC